LENKGYAFLFAVVASLLTAAIALASLWILSVQKCTIAIRSFENRGRKVRKKSSRKASALYFVKDAQAS